MYRVQGGRVHAGCPGTARPGRCRGPGKCQSAGAAVVRRALRLGGPVGGRKSPAGQGQTRAKSLARDSSCKLQASSRPAPVILTFISIVLFERVLESE